MGTQAGVGLSHHRNPRVAGREAAERALTAAAVERPDFVMMFGSVGYDQRALVGAVRKATGQAPLIGCSGEGIIAEGECDESNFAVAVMAISSDELSFRRGVTTGLQADAALVGRQVGQAVQTELRPDTLALIAFADGLTFNFDQFRDGLEGSLERRLPIIGGTAGDNYMMERTYQYYDDEIVSDGVVWAVLSGDARLACSVNHGCYPLGTERTVTRSEGNLLYEIDGVPVLDVLKEYVTADEVEDWGKTFVMVPLGFRVPQQMEGYDDYLVRVMTHRDDATGAVSLPVEVPQGSKVWIMRRDYDKVERGIDTIAQDLKETLGDARPKLVFQFDCAGRGKVLMRDHQKVQLLDTLQESLGRDVPWIGFYTYGEFGPVGEQNCFHNWTAVVAALY